MQNAYLVIQKENDAATVNIQALNTFKLVRPFIVVEIVMQCDLHNKIVPGVVKNLIFLHICDCFALLQHLSKLLESKYEGKIKSQPATE